MANKVNLVAGDIVHAAIMHIPNNEYRYTNVGVISALRSPQSAAIIENTDPRNAMADGRLVLHAAGTTNPSVTVNYKPAIAVGGSTTRQNLEGGGLAGTSAPTAGSNTAITFSNYREIVVEGTTLTNNILKSKDSQDYINSILSGKLSVSGQAGNRIAEKTKQLLGSFGHTFVQRADADMFKPVNTVLTTALVAGIGKNAAFPADITPSAAAPNVAVTAFESDGYTPHPAFFHAIRDTKLKNKFQGRPIMIGGSKAEMFFRTQSLVGLASTGFELGSLISLLDVDFYYDESIDTNYGANYCIMIEPNAACLQIFTEHDPVLGVVNTPRHKNMDFGYGSLTIAQAKATNSLVPESLTLPFDFRANEDLDATDFPIDQVALGMKYGIYTRPTSFLTTEAGNILADVTGIYGFELTNAA